MMMPLLLLLAAAPSPEEQTLIDERNASLQAQLQETNKRCGTTLTAAMDWESYLPAVRASVKPGNSLRDATSRVAGGCGLAITAISDVCGRYKDYGKAAVAKGVTSVACTLKPGEKASGVVMELKDGVLAAQSNLQTYDDQGGMALAGILATVPDATMPVSITVMERAMLDERMDGRMKEISALAARRCGAEIPVVIDWEALLPHFRAANPGNTKQAVFSSMEGCIGTLEVIAPMCHHGNLSKAFASGKIKSLKCTLLDPKVKRKVELGLKDGVLTTKLNAASANFEEQARAFLEKQ